jgi:uncharacterized protein YcbX
LYRYLVKSMAGESLSEIDVSWHGLVGDRRWAFVRDGVTQSGFPWLTLRERSDMNRYEPSLADPSRPDKSNTSIRTPSGTVFDVTDPALAAELWPEGARVIRQDRGVFDTFPLSLISTQTLSRLSAITGKCLAIERFRPNILVEAASEEEFPEDRWVGCVLRIGGLRMRIDKRDGRCSVITVDPGTGHRTPEILRAVVQEREGCAGVYGSTVQPGRIALDDSVLIESSSA